MVGCNLCFYCQYCFDGYLLYNLLCQIQFHYLVLFVHDPFLVLKLALVTFSR